MKRKEPSSTPVLMSLRRGNAPGTDASVKSAEKSLRGIAAVGTDDQSVSG